MNIIVLSGPICAGKSTVASFFKDIGYTVINSDNLAKKIIKGDDVLQRKISKLFNITLNLAPWQSLFWHSEQS